MKKIIMLKLESLLLVTVAVAYGFQLVTSPDIFNKFDVYRLLATFTNSTTVGMLFLFVGLLKLSGILTDNNRIKRFSLTTLAILWTVLWVLFSLSNVSNTINLLPFSMAGLSIIISVREVY